MCGSATPRSRRGDVNEARDYFTKAVKFDDRNKNAHYNLGYVYQTSDQKPADAEREYRAAIKLDPGFDRALYSLAIVRSRAQAIDEAISLYRRAIVANPNFAEAHFNLGLLLRDRGDRAQGDAEIAKGVALNPELGARFAPTTTTTVKKR